MNTDQVKGTANKAMGKVKEAVGKAVDSPETVAKGVAQQVKGNAQKTTGDVKEAIKDRTK